MGRSTSLGKELETVGRHIRAVLLRDARNNERHGCTRRRDREPAVPV